MHTNGFHTKLVNALAAALQDDSAARMESFRKEMASIIPRQHPGEEDVMSDDELAGAFAEVMRDDAH
jgi:hypothetical protein